MTPENKLERVKKVIELVDSILTARNKESAKIYLQRLEAEARNLNGTLSPYTREKLSQVISCSRAASGQVKDKDHWIKQTEHYWGLFQREASREAEHR